jgi:excisionase family DNA binding protein
MDKIVFTTLTTEELKEVFSQVVDSKLGDIFANRSVQTEQSQDAYATWKEVAERLRISLPTLNSLTKQGVLKAKRINRRVLYRWSEVEAQLQAIETTKYKRKDLC